MDLAGRWTWLNTGPLPVAPMRDRSPEPPTETSIQVKLRRYRKVVEGRSEKQLEQSAYHIEPRLPARPRALRRNDRSRGISRVPSGAPSTQSALVNHDSFEELGRTPSITLSSRPGTAGGPCSQQSSRPGTASELPPFLKEMRQAAVTARPATVPTSSEMQRRSDEQDDSFQFCENSRLRPRPPSGRANSNRPVRNGRVPSAGRRKPFDAAQFQRKNHIAPGLPGSQWNTSSGSYDKAVSSSRQRQAADDISMSTQCMFDASNVYLMSKCPEAAEVPPPAALWYGPVDDGLTASENITRQSPEGELSIDRQAGNVHSAVHHWVSAAYARFAIRSSETGHILRECAKWLALTCNTRGGALHSLADLEAACLDLGIEQLDVTAVSSHLWADLAVNGSLPVLALSRLIEDNPVAAQDALADVTDAKLSPGQELIASVALVQAEVHQPPPDELPISWPPSEQGGDTQAVHAARTGSATPLTAQPTREGLSLEPRHIDDIEVTKDVPSPVQECPETSEAEDGSRDLKSFPVETDADASTSEVPLAGGEECMHHQVQKEHCPEPPEVWWSRSSRDDDIWVLGQAQEVLHDVASRVADIMVPSVARDIASVLVTDAGNVETSGREERLKSLSDLSDHFEAECAAAYLGIRLGQIAEQVEAKERVSVSGYVQARVKTVIQKAENRKRLEASASSSSSASPPGCPPCSRHTTVRCKEGHLLQVRKPSDDGWACNGRFEAWGCKSNLNNFFQSRGMTRFECRRCNFDLCERCHGFLMFTDDWEGYHVNETPIAKEVTFTKSDEDPLFQENPDKEDVARHTSVLTHRSMSMSEREKPDLCEVNDLEEDARNAASVPATVDHSLNRTSVKGFVQKVTAAVVGNRTMSFGGRLLRGRSFRRAASSVR